MFSFQAHQVGPPSEESSLYLSVYARLELDLAPAYPAVGSPGVALPVPVVVTLTLTSTSVVVVAATAVRVSVPPAAVAVVMMTILTSLAAAPLV